MTESSLSLIFVYTDTLSDSVEDTISSRQLSIIWIFFKALSRSVVTEVMRFAAVSKISTVAIFI